MRYTYLCEYCGYSDSISEEQMYYEYKCQACGEIVKLKEENGIDTDDITLVTDKLIINQMELELERLGNQRVHEIVESMTDPITRTKYRASFILAGGEIPESPECFVQINERWFLTG